MLAPLTTLYVMFVFDCEHIFQESVHSTWLNNGLDEFQSRLTDALTGAADVREGHSPLTRAAAATGAGGGSKQLRPPPVR